MGCGPSKPTRAPEDEDGAPYSKQDVEGRGKHPPAGGVKVFPPGPNRKKGRRSESDDDSRSSNKTASLDRSTKNRGSILRDSKDRAKKSFSLDRRNAPSMGRFKYGNDKGLKNSSTDYLPGGGSRRGRKPSGDGKPKDKSKKEEKDISSGNIIAGAGIAGTAAVTAGITAAMTRRDEESLKKRSDDGVNGTLADFIGNGRNSAGSDSRRYSTGLDSADDVLAGPTEKAQEAALIERGERDVKSPLNEARKSPANSGLFRADSVEQGQEVIAPSDAIRNSFDSTKSPRSPRSPTTPVRSAGSRSPTTPVRSPASRSPTTPVRSATPRSQTTPVRSAVSRTPTPPVHAATASRSPTPPVRSAGSRSPTTPVRSAGSRSPTTPVRSATPRSPTTPVRSAGSRSPTTPVRSAASRSPTTLVRSAGPRSPTSAVGYVKNDFEDSQETNTDTLDIVSQESKIQRQDSENIDSAAEALEALDKDSAEQELKVFRSSANGIMSSSVSKLEDSQEESTAGLQDSTEEYFKESEESVMDALDFEARNGKEKLKAAGGQIEDDPGSLTDVIDSTADEYDSQKHSITKFEESQESATEVIDFIDSTLQESQESATEVVDSADTLLEVSQEYTTDVIDSTGNELEESQESETNVTDSAVSETEESQDLLSKTKKAAGYDDEESQESAANENVTSENVLEGSQESTEDVSESATDRVEEFPGPAEYTTDSTYDRLEESQESAGHAIYLAGNKYDGYQESTEDNLDSVTGKFEESLEYAENETQEIHESSTEAVGPDEMQESTPTNTEGELSQDAAATYSEMTDKDEEEEEEETANETTQDASEENSGEAEQEHSESIYGSLKESVADPSSDTKKSFTASEDETLEPSEEEPHESSEVDCEVKIRVTPDVVERSNTEDNLGSTSENEEEEDRASSDEQEEEEKEDKEGQNEEEPTRDDDDDVETRTSFFGSLKNSIVETVDDIKDAITGDKESPREEEKTADSIDKGLAAAAGATVVAAVGTAAVTASSQSEEGKNVGVDADAPEGVNDTEKTSLSPENEDEQGETSFFSSVKNSLSNAKNFVSETVEDIKESITGEAEDAKKSTEETADGITDTVAASTSSAVQELQEETEEVKDSLVGVSGEIENKVSETLEDAKSTAEDLVSSAGNEAGQLKDSVAETVEGIEDTVSGKIEGAKEDMASAAASTTSALENLEKPAVESYRNVTGSVLGVAEDSREGVQELADTAKSSTSSALEEIKQDVSSALATGESAVTSSLPMEGIFTATPVEVDGSRSDAHDTEAGQGVLAKDDTEDVGGAQEAGQPQDQTSTSPKGERRMSSPLSPGRRHSLPPSPGGPVEGDRNYLDTLSPFWKSRSQTPEEDKEEEEQEQEETAGAEEKDKKARSRKSSFSKDETERKTSPSRRKSLSKDETKEKSSPSRRKSLPKDEKEATSPSRRKSIPKDEKEATSPSRRKSIPKDEKTATSPARRKSIPKDEKAPTSPARRKSIPKDEKGATSPARRKSISKDEKAPTSPARRKSIAKDEEATSPARRKSISKDEKGSPSRSRRMSISKDGRGVESPSPSPSRRKSIAKDDKASPSRRKSISREEGKSPSPSRWRTIIEKREEVRKSEGGKGRLSPRTERKKVEEMEKVEEEEPRKSMPVSPSRSPRNRRNSSAQKLKNSEVLALQSLRESLQLPPSVAVFIEKMSSKIKANDAITAEMEKAAVKIQSSYRGYKTRKEFGPILKKKKAEGAEDGSGTDDKKDQDMKPSTPRSPRAPIKSFSLDINTLITKEKPTKDSLQLPSSVDEYMERIKEEEERKKKEEEEARLKAEAEKNEKTPSVSLTTEGGVTGVPDGNRPTGIESQEGQEVRGSGNELTVDSKNYPATSPSSPAITRIRRVMVKSFSFEVKDNEKKKEKTPKEALQLPPSVDLFMQRLEEERKAAEAAMEREKAEKEREEGEMGEKSQGNKSPAAPRSPKSPIKSFSLDTKNKESLSLQSAKENLKLPPSVSVFMEKIKIEEERLNATSPSPGTVSPKKQSDDVGAKTSSTLDVPRARGADGASSDSEWADLSSREVSPAQEKLKNSTSSINSAHTAESKAATKIQALYRGYTVRKRLKKGGGSNRVSVPSLPHGLQKPNIKGKSSTRTPLSPNRAAQSYWVVVNTAASKIQAGFRGYKVRKALKMLQKSRDFQNIVKSTKRRSF